jgi:transcriptional regulator with XRE-family HTH domain
MGAWRRPGVLFHPSAIRRYRNQRRLTLENVSGIAGMSVQHLSEIESSKRDPRLSSIERIADAMELAVILVPEHMAPDIRRYIASQGRVFTTTQSTKETSNDDPT